MSAEHHRSVFDPNTQRQLAKETANNVSSRYQMLQVYLTLEILAESRRRKGITETRFSDTEQDAMAILYGEHARILGDKSRFPGLVREIGFKAADSLLIRTDKIPPDQRGKAALDYFQNPERKVREDEETRLFVKPLNGTWQRDLAEFDTSTEEGKIAFNAYLANITEYTLVQEFIPHEKCLRYMRYQNKKGQVYVACFEFTEDESSASKRVNIPLIGRIVKKKSAGVNLNEIITSVINTSAIPLGNNDHQLDNLNRFMDEFSKALEAKLGGEVPLLSVDLGISDMRQLVGNYDPERMKNAVAFFETQTSPQSWAHNRFFIIPYPVKTYRDFWKAFMQDHGKDVVARAKALRKSRGQKAKHP